MPEEKEKARQSLSSNCDATTFINRMFKFVYASNIKEPFIEQQSYMRYLSFPYLLSENVSGIAVTNLENSQMLHGDEAGSVTMPVYSSDQALTPVYIVITNCH